jgi:hypothetical protein
MKIIIIKRLKTTIINQASGIFVTFSSSESANDLEILLPTNSVTDLRGLSSRCAYRCVVALFACSRRATLRPKLGVQVTFSSSRSTSSRALRAQFGEALGGNC